MQGWIHGSQIQSLVQMADFEIIQGCITKSLTPHNDHGLPIRPADVMVQQIADLEHELFQLDEVAWDLIGVERERMIVNQIEPLQERLQSCKMYLEAIKTSNWDEFELPTDQGIEGCFASCLINCRYRAEEVERILPRQLDTAHDEMPPAVESRSPRSVHAQECNKTCREIAKRIWDRQPDFTIAAMINHSEIIRQARKPDGSSYSDMTIRNWIRDLCPNPKPGRRPVASPSNTISK
jgi:preprotein translocase subunit Sss1